MSDRVCGRCGSALSQYNTDATCALCAKSGLPTGGVPDRAWRDVAVQLALQNWEFGELLRLVRKRSGLSQTAVSELTALPQSFISGLERGQKQIGSPATLLELLNGLGLPPDLRSLFLAPLSTPQLRPAPDVALDPDLPWTADRMVASLERSLGGVAMKRRKVLALSGAALTQHVLQSAIAPAESMAASAASGSAQVSDSLINSLQGTTDALRHVDATNGSGSLAGTAKAHLKMLLHLLKHGTYRERAGRRLAAVAADTAAQTGWYTFDSGDHDAAQGLFLGALRAAHASGDPRLRAGALGFLAIHSYSTGDPRDAITAARTARQALTHLDTPALHAMLLTRQARGHARLREERHALAALSEAESLCAGGPGENDPHWLYWINEGEILGQKGSCHFDLGQPQRAAESFAATRGILRAEEPRTTAQFLSRSATSQMRAGDTDAGCATAHEALTLATGIRSSRLDDHLRTMLQEARSRATTAPARDLVARGHDLMRQRAAE